MHPRHQTHLNTLYFMNSLFYRCHFACSKTIRVLTNLISNIYSAHSSDLLLQPTNLHQLILNHSKFLEIILGEPTASGNPDTKGTSWLYLGWCWTSIIEYFSPFVMYFRSSYRSVTNGCGYRRTMLSFNSFIFHSFCIHCHTQHIR